MIGSANKPQKASEVFAVLTLAVFSVYSYATGGLVKYIYGNYRNASMTLLLSVFLFTVFECVNKKRILVKKDLLVYPLLALIVLHGNANLRNNDVVNAVMTIGVFAFSILLRRIDNWERPMLKILASLSAFNALASVALGLLPSLYLSRVVPLFADSNRANLLHLQSRGILCGLTNSNSFNAILMVNGLSVMTAFIITGKSLTRRRWLDKILAILFLVVLLMTGKRGPLVFCIAAIFTASYVYNSNRPASRLIKIIGIVILLMGLWVVGSSVFPRVFPAVGRLLDTDSVDVVRLALYNQAINVFKSKPFFGIGWDAFRYNYTTFGYALNIHNIYIQLLCECGIIGALPFFLFFIWNITQTIKKLHRERMKTEHSADLELILFFSVLNVTVAS